MATPLGYRTRTIAENVAEVCTQRVVVARSRSRYMQWHVCHPSTARRRGWKVVAK